ncbi:glycoside hydrolase family 3 C-terminal domain-containing protein [Prescottella agglutinans]|uniref:Beta-glucosidase n=1 Tax=Prescottella agglutinans TaxID=1644129 RepID=A0ABT6M717_9NOCA|nr:glycoside hydrolase family 3 C-terminal domain-containing protein [Prescottella agglutinans]MDH6280087.1 beta-glucosidase [Prescottella agglutinans]
MNTTTTDLVSALESLTVEEKASLTVGAGFWETTAIEAQGIPSIFVSDGPHGLRKQSSGNDHLGILAGEPATCFPPAVALAATWDTSIAERVGAAIADEAKALGVSVVLGPGVNIKRSIRCGRNFEYYSEDPYLAGRLGAAWVHGAQSRGIGTSLKHFAANSQETARMTIDMRLDARTLHEIELRAFEHVVKTEQPWTVMCAYNRLNGVHASEDRWLLTELLRDRWGFEGLVVSDWGAVVDRARALKAGLDLEMPTSWGRGIEAITNAVADGSLTVEELDTAAARVLTLVQKAAANLDATATPDHDAHHALAREAAEAAIVLLRNEGGLLPLDPSTGTIAVIGEFARTPRYQGAGSSQIVPTQLDTALDALQAQVSGAGVTFEPGFRLDGEPDAALADAAVAAARDADVAVLFLGLPDLAESEGYDRTDIDLPAAQIELLDRVLEVTDRVVVVLSNGAAVRLAGFADRVPAILEGALLGQGGGHATARVLLGAVNPSGRIAETIPARLEDTPDYLSFPGDGHSSTWSEGVFVGYRWYDARDIAVSYPFGHGLSYTEFEYRNLEVTNDGATVTVTVDVANVGDRDGAEVVQVYSAQPGSRVARAPRELRGFRKVHVPAGETVRARIEFAVTELAYFDEAHDRFTVEAGTVEIHVGASSRDLRLQATIEVEGDEPSRKLTWESSIFDWMSHPEIGPSLAAAFGQTGISMAMDDPNNQILVEWAKNSPIRLMFMMSDSTELATTLDAWLATQN